MEDERCLNCHQSLLGLLWGRPEQGFYGHRVVLRSVRSEEVIQTSLRGSEESRVQRVPGPAGLPWVCSVSHVGSGELRRLALRATYRASVSD